MSLCTFTGHVCNAHRNKVEAGNTVNIISKSLGHAEGDVKTQQNCVLEAVF